MASRVHEGSDATVGRYTLRAAESRTIPTHCSRRASNAAGTSIRQRGARHETGPNTLLGRAVGCARRRAFAPAVLRWGYAGAHDVGLGAIVSIPARRSHSDSVWLWGAGRGAGSHRCVAAKVEWMLPAVSSPLNARTVATIRLESVGMAPLHRHTRLICRSRGGLPRSP